MATGNEIGLSQPAASTITMKIATVTQNWGSSARHQELLTIAGAESTLEITRVMATAPGSTDYGVVVRIAGGPSSAADAVFRVNQGVGNSSLADAWQVRTSPQSTLWASSAGFHFDSSGALNANIVGGQSTIMTVARQVGNSSAADYMPARIVDSSGTGFHGPTNPMPIAVTDSSNAVVKSGDSANNAIRVNVVAGAAGGSTIYTMSVPASWATVAQSTVGQTTATTIISSAATVPYVAAFTATSTEAGPIVCAFMEGSTVLWPFTLWAEGGVPNVSQAVGPTSFIFKGSANRPISLNILSGSTGTIYLGVTYKQE
jgi:hypothetical protein